ncbi:MAG: hypothetical protein DK302_000070 [Chloroflexi bacterium]|nr:MAG: hypothetical protein DK302_000070 [Chloroflexota bacterium]
MANIAESTRLSKPLLAKRGSKKKNPIAKASERIIITAIDPLPNSSSSPAAIFAEYVRARIPIASVSAITAIPLINGIFLMKLLNQEFIGTV